MTIFDKTRKILWGRSGNRCAMCRKELVFEATAADDECVVGDECHIISPQPNGPRHDSSLKPQLFDAYENILLLCKVHHKLIDDQASTYTVDLLRRLKQNHEAWVSQTLSDVTKPKPVRIRRVAENIPSHLRRVASGKELLEIVSGTCAWQQDYDEPKTSEETDLIASFSQLVRDYGELDLDEPAERIHAAANITTNLKVLEDAGFFVFAGIEKRILEGGNGHPQNFPIAIVHILKQDNKSIITKPVEP
ncbi:MAG: HNH endonuclease [Candidatus Omnitrophota bacterium]